MRAALALLLLPFLFLAGCTEVHGDPPRSACGGDGRPARSAIVGTQASWAGRTFTAEEDGVQLWVEGGEVSVTGDWWGADARAWAVVALAPGSEVVAASAGLVQYGGERTTLRVGGAGPTVGDGRMPAAHELIGPITLNAGEKVLVAGAADTPVDSLALQLRWEGCGRTGEIVWGVGEGAVATWGDMEGTTLSNGALGTLAYEARFQSVAASAVVLAQPPPGGDPTGMNAAQLTTSRGAVELMRLTFAVHDKGTVRYEATHAGESGREPLVAILPIEFAAAGAEFRRAAESIPAEPAPNAPLLGMAL